MTTERFSSRPCGRRPSPARYGWSTRSGPGSRSSRPEQLAEDAKTGVSLGFSHPHAFKRVAVVTDVDWIVKAMHGFGWMTPGEVKTYALEQLEEAKSWVAG